MKVKQKNKYYLKLTLKKKKKKMEKQKKQKNLAKRQEKIEKKQTKHLTLFLLYFHDLQRFIATFGPPSTTKKYSKQANSVLYLLH